MSIFVSENARADRRNVSAKIVNFIKKNSFVIGALLLFLAVMVVVSCSPTGRTGVSRRGQAPIFDRSATQSGTPETPTAAHDGANVQGGEVSADISDSTAATDTTAFAVTDPAADAFFDKSLAGTEIFGAEISDLADSLVANPLTVDPSIGTAGAVDISAADSLTLVDRPAMPELPPFVVDAPTDTIPRTPLPADIATTSRPAADTTVRKPRQRAFLESPVEAKAQDSLIYDVRRRFLYHYGVGNKSDLTYEDNNLKADFIIVNVNTKEIFGTGLADSVGVRSRPEFVQGGGNYTMDTVIYNLNSKQAIVTDFATKDGEGYMTGRRMKRMRDNSINIEGANYTTCDRIDHPHFYIRMTKAKTIPGKKVITGPAYFVMEDVPIFFLGIPGGFFPISTGPTAGLVMPTWGEEGNRGFYLRALGYYLTFGDHVDLNLSTDIYTRGSWGISASSRYVWRYKFNGSFSTNYQRYVTGEKGSPDYNSSSTFNLLWNHTQDPKANPRQNFSANVNFSTAGQKQLATTSLQDHLNTNTSSSISYSRNWTAGSTNINMTAQFNMSTNSRDSVINATLPNISLSVGSFAPFKRKLMAGKQRWYEKITLSYSMQAQNSTGSVKEYEVFTPKTMRNMQNGVTHTIPVKTSFNLLGYINFAPSFNYREAWNFKRQYRVWDPSRGQNGAEIPVDERPTEFGFFRTYSWDVSGSFSTKLYGDFSVVRKPGKTGWLQAIRHVLTPSVGFTYAPDFQHPRYGFYEYVQTGASGTFAGYQSVQGSPTISPAAARASINFSLGNQLEIKTRNRRDTVEKKKITIIEQLSLSSNYDFLKDTMQLAPFNIQFRTGEIFKGFSIQLSGTWSPYLYVRTTGDAAKPTRHYNIGHGKFGRIINSSWSFGHTFNSPGSKTPSPNSINGAFVVPYDPYNFTNNLDPTTRRQYMVQQYYDFTVPWSFTFNYSVNYSYTGMRPVIMQTLGFNGTVSLTEKWGVNFNSGYDFTRRKLSHMQFSLTRDLHCWEMSFQWVPMGMVRSYAFHIGIKSGMLRDIKYDKSSNAYDSLVR
jgi:hypothetical protein